MGTPNAPTFPTPTTMPSNIDRRRKTFAREVWDAIRRANDDANLAPLEHVLQSLRKWLARPLNKPLDARLAWSFWLDGEMLDGRTARTLPLRDLLDAPGIPDEALRELLDLTGRLAERPHAVPTVYTAVPARVWLCLAHLPEVPALVTEQGLMAHWRRAVPADTSDQAVWSQALASEILADSALWTPAAHRRRVRAFDAAQALGWLPEDVLDTWAAPLVALSAAPPPRRHAITLGPPRADAPGSLVDFLTLSEQPGGLLDRWRARHPHDWSTRVSPASGTTVWAGLLLNPNPALLHAWLRDDPSALDRPVPIGRWYHVNYHDQQDLTAFRSVAGRVASRGDLKVVLDRADPATARRVNTWWNDPAPTLRNTLDVWWNDLIPLNDTPPPHRDAWDVLRVSIEQWDLEAALPAAPEDLVIPPRRNRL